MRAAPCAVPVALIALIALVAPVAVPGDADACTLIPVEISPHARDPAHAGDRVAPAAPQGTFSIVYSEIDAGCGTSTCDGKTGKVLVEVTGGDDRTPAERLGYIFTITGGDVPANIYSAVLDGMPVFQPQGSFQYSFNYDDHDFAFDLEVRTIDLNGNISEPTLLHIAQRDGGGCSTASSVSSEWLVVPIIAFVLRRRRR